MQRNPIRERTATRRDRLERLWPLRGVVDKIGVVLLIVALSAGTLADESAWKAWRAYENGQFDEAEQLLLPVGLSDARAWWLRGRLDLDSDNPWTRLGALENTDPEQAVAEAARLLTAATDPGDSLLALERFAKLAIDLGRIEDAEPALTLGLELAERLERPAAGCLADLNMGRLMIRTRRIDEAETYLEAARTAAETLELHRWHGNACIALSVVHRLRMDLDTALAFREEAYQAYVDGDDLAGQARSSHYIATIFAMKGELTQAMIRLQRAEELARRSESDDVLSGCLGDQAGIHYLIGEFDEALARYFEAIELAGDPRRRGMYAANIASILGTMGRQDEALGHIETALDVVADSGDRRTESAILLLKGQILCDVGRFDEGLPVLADAVEKARAWELPLDEATALQSRGHALLDAGRLDEAEATLTEAAVLIDELDYFDMVESTRIGQARVARKRGRLQEALSHLEEAAATVLSVRRRSGGSAAVQSGYLAQVGRTFDEMVNVLYELHDDDPAGGFDRRAWQAAQQARARSMLDMLAEAEVNLHLRADTSFQERETTLLEGIAGLEARIAENPDSAEVLSSDMRRLESRLTTLEAELREADPRYADLRYPRSVELSALRSETLRPGEAILEYQLGKEHSHLWLITPDRFVMRRLPGRHQIEAPVRALLPLMRDPNLTGAAAAWYAGPARDVARLILDPIADDLAGVEHLIVVPDGTLHYLPFEALTLEDSDATNFAALPWLIRDTDVAYCLSASTLARLRQAEPLPADAPPLLLLGDPELPGPDAASVFLRSAGAAGLNPPPAAAAEIEALVNLFGRRAHVFAGEHASPNKLRAPPAPGRFGSVHFTTHGFFNEERPQYSGLILAADDGDDGFLSTAEIFSLDLDCDQVVLSACSTALGELRDGEGLVGLTQAFLYAGARSVVSALWDVSGNGAAMFMADYYKRCRDGESRAAALSATKRVLAADPGAGAAGLPRAHPAFWAAFVANGDAR